jgi:pimeloyl-ACP methyl ester carboxylesterase
VTATDFVAGNLAGPPAETADGVTIATYDLGGDGPLLVLAHATGFHGRVWLPVAAHLRDRYHCIAFDARGHGQSGKAPGGHYDWNGFGLDVLAVVAAATTAWPGRADGPDGAGGAPPRAVGHSCGGAAVLLAEEAAPGTFEALYCYEPVVAAFDFRAESPSGDPLAAGARRRRPIFASRAAALSNYAAKATFAAFDPAALEAYVEWGFHDLADGTVVLACDPQDEARIYEQAPYNQAYQHLDQVGCPVTLAAGGRLAHFGRDVVTAVAARIAGETTVEIDEDLGHFGPLEQPHRVAASVLAAFDARCAG